MIPKAYSDKQVLFINSGWIHPPFLGRQHARKLLEQIPGFSLHSATTMEALVEHPPQGYDALVLYFHDKVISPEALATFEAFVQDGGGVLTIHSATASFMGSQRYFNILGGRFIGHGPVETFIVEAVDDRDEVFSGISSFKTRDELYLHELADDLNVQFYAMHEGERAPMVWTRQYGRGRVCYVCPGHRSQTMQQREVQTLLRQGLKWVCE